MSEPEDDMEKPPGYADTLGGPQPPSTRPGAADAGALDAPRSEADGAGQRTMRGTNLERERAEAPAECVGPLHRREVAHADSGVAEPDEPDDLRAPHEYAQIFLQSNEEQRVRPAVLARASLTLATHPTALHGLVAIAVAAGAVAISTVALPEAERRFLLYSLARPWSLAILLAATAAGTIGIRIAFGSLFGLSRRLNYFHGVLLVLVAAGATYLANLALMPSIFHSGVACAAVAVIASGFVLSGRVFKLMWAWQEGFVRHWYRYGGLALLAAVPLLLIGAHRWLAVPRYALPTQRFMSDLDATEALCRDAARREPCARAVHDLAQRGQAADFMYLDLLSMRETSVQRYAALLSRWIAAQPVLASLTECGSKSRADESLRALNTEIASHAAALRSLRATPAELVAIEDLFEKRPELNIQDPLTAAHATWLRQLLIDHGSEPFVPETTVVHALADRIFESEWRPAASASNGKSAARPMSPACVARQMESGAVWQECPITILEPLGAELQLRCVACLWRRQEPGKDRFVYYVGFDTPAARDAFIQSTVTAHQGIDNSGGGWRIRHLAKQFSVIPISGNFPRNLQQHAAEIRLDDE